MGVLPRTGTRNTVSVKLHLPQREWEMIRDAPCVARISSQRVRSAYGEIVSGSSSGLLQRELGPDALGRILVRCALLQDVVGAIDLAHRLQPIECSGKEDLCTASAGGLTVATRSESMMPALDMLWMSCVFVSPLHLQAMARQ